MRRFTVVLMFFAFVGFAYAADDAAKDADDSSGITADATKPPASSFIAAKKSNAAILAVKPKATIKFSHKRNIVSKTLNRDKLWEVQTPQVFKKSLILEAYRKYSKSNVTDDASLVEKLGKRVVVVEGDYRNIKITTAEDLLVAGLIIKRKLHAI